MTFRMPSAQDIVTCRRCDRCLPLDQAVDQNWNVTLRQGIPVNYTCGACQSPAEDVQAQINYAMLDYTVDAFGLRARPKDTED